LLKDTGIFGNAEDIDQNSFCAFKFFLKVADTFKEIDNIVDFDPKE